MIEQSIIIVGIQGVLGVVMAGIGAQKLGGAEAQVQNFDRFGYPQWVRLLVGVAEVLGGLALLTALFTIPMLAIVGVVLIAGVLVGAIGTHLRVGDPISNVAAPGVLLLLSISVLLYQIDGFR